MKNLKSVKVFYHGVRMKDVYPHATKWQVIKYRVAKFFRMVVIASFIVGAVAGAYKAGNISTQAEVSYATIDNSEKILSAKIEALKNAVVDDIMKCESAGHGEDAGIIIMDTNNKLSYGQMQWQESSYKYYYKLYHGKDLTSKVAKLHMLDTEKARSLAKQVMFESKNKANDWYNCAVKTDANNRIDIIKQLEK